MKRSIIFTVTAVCVLMEQLISLVKMMVKHSLQFVDAFLEQRMDKPIQCILMNIQHNILCLSEQMTIFVVFYLVFLQKKIYKAILECISKAVINIYYTCFRFHLASCPRYKSPSCFLQAMANHVSERLHR